MGKRYQVVSVGAGPSTIFAALTLSRTGIADIAIFEKGKDIHERKRGRGMELLCGWGGGGAFSDGKLTLSPKGRRILERYCSASRTNRSP